MKIENKAPPPTSSFVRDAPVVRRTRKAPPRNFTLRISDELLEELRRSAERHDRSQQWVALRALREWLEADAQRR